MRKKKYLQSKPIMFRRRISKKCILTVHELVHTWEREKGGGMKYDRQPRQTKRRANEMKRRRTTPCCTIQHAQREGRRQRRLPRCAADLHGSIPSLSHSMRPQEAALLQYTQLTIASRVRTAVESQYEVSALDVGVSTERFDGVPLLVPFDDLQRQRQQRRRRS